MRWAELIDKEADLCEDFACFAKKMKQWADDTAFTHPYPFKKDGFNSESEANGEQNAAHVSGVLGYGTIAGHAHQLKDFYEYYTSTKPEDRRESAAEVYADYVGMEIMEAIMTCLAFEKAWYKLQAYDDDAWRKCRRIPGALWRWYFCAEWG